MIRRRVIAQGMATERAIHIGVDHLASPEKQYTKNTELQSRLSPQEMQPLWLRVSELIRSDRMDRIQIRGQSDRPATGTAGKPTPTLRRIRQAHRSEIVLAQFHWAGSTELRMWGRAIALPITPILQHSITPLFHYSMLLCLSQSPPRLNSPACCVNSTGQAATQSRWRDSGYSILETG